mmetsp:Transcript_108211/g.312744  ORF Transcript_108211/g.312744 Transcript_108211/m.312744 type:complete len:219 (+) Transcript_108211:842-1498(+)
MADERRVLLQVQKVPPNYRGILRAREQVAAVAQHASNRAGVLLPNAQRGPQLRVPPSDGLVIARAVEHIHNKRQAPYRAGVPLHAHIRRQLLCVPTLHSPIDGTAEEHASGDEQACYRPGMALQRPHPAAAAGVHEVHLAPHSGGEQRRRRRRRGLTDELRALGARCARRGQHGDRPECDPAARLCAACRSAHRLAHPQAHVVEQGEPQRAASRPVER